MQKFSSLYTKNLADKIQMLENMAHTHLFVQQVVNYKEASPAVIIFTSRQISDIRRLCVINGSVLGVNKTVNLTELHVTATVFGSGEGDNWRAPIVHWTRFYIRSLY